MNENKMNINWYPGHMAKTKKQIIEDLKLIDIVIEILDARVPLASQNPDIEEIIKDKKKIILSSPIKTLGEKEVTVKLHPKVSVILKITINEQK